MSAGKDRETGELSDDELMVLVAEAVAEADLVTDARREAARAAFTWRTVDAELMELLHDSALDVGSAVRSTGEVTERVLSFGAEGLGLEVEIGRRIVLGQVLPAQRATVVLQHVDAGEQTAETDGSGFFRVGDVSEGLARFVVTTSEQRLTTAWVHV